MIIVGGITIIDYRQSYWAPDIIKIYFEMFGSLPGFSHLLSSLACQTEFWVVFMTVRGEKKKKQHNNQEETSQFREEKMQWTLLLLYLDLESKCHPKWNIYPSIHMCLSGYIRIRVYIYIPAEWKPVLDGQIWRTIKSAVLVVAILRVW